MKYNKMCLTNNGLKVRGLVERLIESNCSICGERTHFVKISDEKGICSEGCMMKLERELKEEYK